MAGSKAASGKNRKYERNKISCASYRSRHQEERNQLRRVTTHLRNQGYESVSAAPADVQAVWQRLVAILPNAEIHAAERRLTPA